MVWQCVQPELEMSCRPWLRNGVPVWFSKWHWPQPASMYLAGSSGCSHCSVALCASSTVVAAPCPRWQVVQPNSVNRSEEHTSELQSPCNLVCRLLLEKKKLDRKSTRLNSSHLVISYAVFCLLHLPWGPDLDEPRARSQRRKNARPRTCAFFLMIRRPPRSTPFPYTTLFRSNNQGASMANKPTSNLSSASTCHNGIQY